MTKAQTAAQNRYIKKKYDRHNLFMIKGKKEKYQAAADKAEKSLNAFIIEAIEEKIERADQ